MLCQQRSTHEAMSYISQRRQEERKRRRSEIIDAAESLYLHTNWDAVTMESVARQARLSRALVYVHFKHKSDLLLALTERAWDVLRSRVEDARLRALSGMDQIEAMGRAYVAYGLEFSHYFDACARLERRVIKLSGQSSKETGALQIRGKVHEAGLASLRAGQQDGSIRADLGDLEITSRVLWGFIHGMTQIAITKAQPLAKVGISVAQLSQQGFALIRHTLDGTQRCLADDR